MKQILALVVTCLVAISTMSGQCVGNAKFAFWGINGSPGTVIDFPNVDFATFSQVTPDSAVLQFVASSNSGANEVSASLYLHSKMSATQAQSSGYTILCTTCEYYLVADESFANWITNSIVYPIANYSTYLVEVGDRNFDGVLDVAGWPVFEHYDGSGVALGNFDFFVQCEDWSNCVVDYVSLQDTICQGSSLVFGNQLLDSVGVYTDTLTNQNDCDSIVTMTLCMWIPDTTFVSDTTCDASTVGMTIEVLQGLSNGCDSIVITTVELMPGGGDTTITVTKFVCDMGLVDTTVQVLVTMTGCDSVVTTITILDPGAGDTTFVTEQSCHVGNAGDTTMTFVSQYGCDSVVVVHTDLVGVDTTLLSATTCDTNQVGISVEVLINQAGCDSMIITTLTFVPSDTVSLTLETCLMDSVGSDSVLVSDASGCMSLQVTNTVFAPSDTVEMTSTTCYLDSVGIDSSLVVDSTGCFSLVVTVTEFEPSTVTHDTLTTCFLDSLGVDSFLVDDGNGCMSLDVVVTLFEPSIVVELNAMTTLTIYS
ncbi:MAG: hypothetical protein Q8O99_06985 [bacterium]|nr:hypothetical protein [bacterium]